MLLLLGQQAKELGELFRVIAASARDLSGKFHEAHRSTIIVDVGEFERTFDKAVKKADEHTASMARQRAQKLKDLLVARVTEVKWKTAQLLLAWDPITPGYFHWDRNY